MNCEKCIVCASYFVVSFSKILAKYPWNAKYDTCIAGLRPCMVQPKCSVTFLHTQLVTIEGFASAVLSILVNHRFCKNYLWVG